MARADRQTVDLSAYPDLVVIYLGMRANSLRGLKTLIAFGPKIDKAVAEQPDGMLLHERMLYSPVHFGMREYWRDFESLEAWTRTLPHKEWWRSYVKDTAGTSFWHETYFMRGGMEAIYASTEKPLGLTAFAPVEPARGAMFSARRRARRDEPEPEQAALAAPYAESDIY
jgi:hypothetical protein